MQNFLNRLSEIQKAASEKRLNLPDLEKLRNEAKKAFDERIEQLMVEYDITKKIKVPRSYIKLWRKRNVHITLPINWRYLISAPFIYSMIFPAIFWHICIEIYQQICFRLYGIPLVDYKEYFIYDRKLLAWLNPWQRINCIYCSYVNNLIRFSSEIGGRTERYWCPIKYYRRISHAHSQYNKFIDPKNPTELKQQWEELQDFSDLEKQEDNNK